MRTRQASICVAALLLLHLQTACTVSQTVPLASVAPGSNITVRFPSGIPVVVNDTERDSTRHREIPGVRAVSGKLLLATADTMRLGPVWSIDAPRVAVTSRFGTASFPTSDDMVVALQRSDPEGAFGVALLLGSIVGLIYFLEGVFTVR